ncbi:MAG: hypothetical protein ACLR6J_15320 [Parabacteroides merdae]
MATARHVQSGTAFQQSDDRNSGDGGNRASVRCNRMAKGWAASSATRFFSRLNVGTAFSVQYRRCMVGWVMNGFHRASFAATPSPSSGSGLQQRLSIALVECSFPQ